MAETMDEATVETAKNPGEASRPLAILRREIDRLLEDFERSLWSSLFPHAMFDIEPFRQRRSRLMAMPAADLFETDDAFGIRAEMPGTDAADVEVKLASSRLTISGRRQSEKEEKKDYLLRERRFGPFERHFRLPDGLDTDQIEATFNKGVLNVTLPKAPHRPSPARKIAVRAA